MRDQFTLTAYFITLALALSNRSSGDERSSELATLVSDVAAYEILGSDQLARKNPRKIGTLAMQPSSGRYVYRWTIDRQVHSDVRLPKGTVFAVAAYDGVRWWDASYSRSDPGRLVMLDVYDVPPISAEQQNREWVRRHPAEAHEATVHLRYASNAPLDYVAMWLGDPAGNPTRIAELITRTTPQREGIPLQFTTKAVLLERWVSGQLDKDGALEKLDEHRTGGGSLAVPLYVTCGCEFRRVESGVEIDEFESILDVRPLLSSARNISWVTGVPPKQKSTSPDRPEVRDAGRAIDQFVP